MFDDERTSFAGKHYQLHDAYAEPKPVQRRPRLWIGGGGEKRLLRLVARHADGWNVAFVAPDAFAHKSAVLDRWCERERRDPRAVLRTVNLGLALAERDVGLAQLEARLEAQFGKTLPFVRPGMLVGTPQQVIDRIGEYRHAGAEWVILALRAPFDLRELELFVERVMPAFR
jgi:alkanesulfonate monooxygenase SsuD/methylene tetrahydromethanopterin reductase-like flavin-dependent oxidoreductase (luciferase family)